MNALGPRNQEGNARHSGEPARFVSLVDQLHRQAEQRRAIGNDKAPQEAQLVRATHRLVWATGLLVVVGFLSFAAAILQWLSLRSTDETAAEQLIAMRSQLSELRAEQRPWVYAAEVAPGGRIVLEGGWYAVPLKFSIKNTGHLPAFFVTPKTNAAILAIGESTKAIKNGICDEYQNTSASAGETLFAGQTVYHGGITSDDYPKVTKKAWDELASGNRFLVVFGCIDYQFPDQPGHHQSRFAFVVGEAATQGVLERIKVLPDDPTTVDIRLISVNIDDNEAPN